MQVDIFNTVIRDRLELTELISDNEFHFHSHWLMKKLQVKISCKIYFYCFALQICHFFASSLVCFLPMSKNIYSLFFKNRASKKAKLAFRAFIGLNTEKRKGINVKNFSFKVSKQNIRSPARYVTFLWLQPFCSAPLSARINLCINQPTYLTRENEKTVLQRNYGTL